MQKVLMQYMPVPFPLIVLSLNMNLILGMNIAHIQLESRYGECLGNCIGYSQRKFLDDECTLGGKDESSYFFT